MTTKPFSQFELFDGPEIAAGVKLHPQDANHLRRDVLPAAIGHIDHLNQCGVIDTHLAKQTRLGLLTAMRNLDANL
jgi:hypothetical protein